MPSLDLYKKIHSEDTLGRVRKNISDMLMDETFSGDVGYQVAYLYDWYHDLKSNERHKLRNLSPSEDEYKIPIEIKYLANASQTYSKDIVTYHIQMRPHQACNVDYYEDYFGKYNAIFPVGLYIDIMDNNDRYNRWMVVATANFYDAQFSTFEILPCDKVFQWVIGGEKINMAGVLRSQNSYNSGIWTDYKFTSVEDQYKFIVPLNAVSEKLYYNQRLILDAFVNTEPRAWQITKVNRLSSNGVALITLAQDHFDQNHDYIERNDDGKIIGMWADYYRTGVEPEDINSEISAATITYKGSQNGQIKVGGSARTLTADKPGGEWIFTIDGEDASALVSCEITDNIVKVKFIGDDSYIGQHLTITYLIDNVVAGEIEMNISSL